MEGFWKATNISGEIYGVFKVEKTRSWYRTYRYQNGDWVRDDDVFYEFGWNDDYDDISEEEAKASMKAMDHAE